MRRGEDTGSGRGFTIIELIVTLAILGVLAVTAMPIAELTVRRAKEQELRLALRQIRSAIDDYKKMWDEGRIQKKVDEVGYPPSLEILASGIDNPKDPGNSKIYLLRRLPRDPFHDDGSVPAAQTWGKRSYKSPPDAPQEGSDVFDVYSLSSGVAINGTPYKDW